MAAVGEWVPVLVRVAERGPKDWHAPSLAGRASSNVLDKEIIFQ